MPDAMDIVAAFARGRCAERVVRVVCGPLPPDHADELAQLVYERLCRLAADDPGRLKALKARGELYAYASGVVRKQYFSNRSEFKNYKPSNHAMYMPETVQDDNV